MSHSQSAYRSCRSTSDIVWTHRWMTSRTQVYKQCYYIIGIDMSSAFDTIRRQKLLETLSTFVNEDELRIARVLLSDTTLEIKMIDAETEKFKSNIGSPQGDGSSGKFFDIYFEYVLHKVRQQLDLCPVQTDATSKPIEIRTPEEAIDADDADFITLEIRKMKFNME